MKLLLTSGGVTNTSIREALIGLLGKPIAASRALCIPTAEYGQPMCTPASALRFVAGQSPAPMCDLGWKSVGLLELTAIPSIGKERWLPWVREADVLLVDGGDATFLCHWMRQTGLVNILPLLSETVWVGMSARDERTSVELKVIAIMSMSVRQPSSATRRSSRASA